MKRFGLRFKMLIIITTFLLIAFGTVTISSYRDATKVVTNQIDQQLITKSDYLREKMQKYFESREVLLESASIYIENMVQLSNGKNELQDYLTSQLERFGEGQGIVDIYVGYPDGTIDCGTKWIPEDPSWKANERSWYIAAEAAKGEVAFTDIYMDVDTKMPVVTVAKAIYNSNNTIAGVIAIDVGLSRLDEIISSEVIGTSGYAFVLDQDGRFLIHPKYDFQEDLASADTIFNITNGSLKSIGEKWSLDILRS